MHYSITIAWLYPELMSTYGDRGNIIVFKKRCEWRTIGVTVVPIDFKTPDDSLASCDLVFGGGAQDRQQAIVIDDMQRKKAILSHMFAKGIPGLFVCGSPQLLGYSYMTADGKKLEGLGIFAMESRHFGHNKPRCIGNVVAQLHQGFHFANTPQRNTIVGFENHGGRTYLHKGITPLANVVKGYGNNGEDGTEGAIYHNCIATYSHGPFLPKNPHIADWLIAKALKVKYGKEVPLSLIDDVLAWQAHDFIVQREKK